MIVTEEWLFPGRKIRYRDFGGDGGGLSKCGHGGESGGGVCFLAQFAFILLSAGPAFK
jgi:hypothetical protein